MIYPPKTLPVSNLKTGSVLGGAGQCKDDMFFHTDSSQAPWYVVPFDDKARARLNCICHILEMIPYKDLKPEISKIPTLKKGRGYKRRPMHQQTFVPKKY